MRKKKIDIKTKLDALAQKGKFQGVFVKVITSDLFWLLIACGIFRLVFYYCLNDKLCPDSNYYMNYSENIFLGQINYLVTPVYPYFIKLIKLFSEENLIRNITLAQSVISFLTIIVFYKTLCAVYKKRVVIIMATFFYGIMPSIISFDKIILTESISISGAVIFLYFIVSYLKNPTRLKAASYPLYIFFLVMLRPSFIILLPIIIIFWGLRMIFLKTERKICLYGLSASAMCILLIMGYTRLNYANNEIKGISAVSTVNLLDIIVNENMYMNGNDPEISTTIKNTLPGPHLPYNTNIRLTLFKNYPHERIDKFLKSCIINQPKSYISMIAKRIYYVIQQPASPDDSFINPKAGSFGKIGMFLLHMITIPFVLIYLMLFFDFIYIIALLIRYRQLPWFKIGLWSVITGQLLLVITGTIGQADYARIFVEALPYVIVLLFGYMDMIVYAVDKGKLAEYPKLSFLKPSTKKTFLGK